MQNFFSNFSDIFINTQKKDNDENFATVTELSESLIKIQNRHVLLNSAFDFEVKEEKVLLIA